MTISNFVFCTSISSRCPQLAQNISRDVSFSGPMATGSNKVPSGRYWLAKNEIHSTKLDYQTTKIDLQNTNLFCAERLGGTKLNYQNTKLTCRLRNWRKKLHQSNRTHYSFEFLFVLSALSLFTGFVIKNHSLRYRKGQIKGLRNLW